jgi:hypothetical protein
MTDLPTLPVSSAYGGEGLHEIRQRPGRV